MDEINRIGHRIKEAREKMGFKQNALAVKVNIAPQTLSAYEKGGKTPTLENLVAIADVLGVSLDDLVWPNRHTKAEKSYTLGDAARMIAALDNGGYITFGDMTFCVIEQRGEYPQEVEAHSSGIAVLNSKLHDFVVQYQKMRSLLSDGTIDTQLFNQWIEGRFYDLAKIPIFDAIEDDGYLPF